MVDRRQLIKTDGTQTDLPCRPHTLAEIKKLIGADCLDFFMLKDRKHVCAVDDVGMINHRPINQKATLLYREICRHGTDGTIHGDVVIVPDADFG